MTLPNATPSVTLQGNGTVTEFSFPFLVLEKEHLFVTLTTPATGEVQTLSQSVFTVEDLGQPLGGLITYPLGEGTAIPSTQFITIRRVVPYEQNLDIETSAFNPDSFEAQLDSTTKQIQQLAEQTGRAMLGPVSEVGILQLATVEVRRNKVLGFDVNGQPTYLGDAPSVSVDSSALVFETLTALGSVNVDANADAVYVLGNSAGGDGGHGTYKRVASQPSHAAWTQSGDGAYWEFAESSIKPQHLGGQPGSYIDTIFSGLITSAQTLGCKIVLDGVYRLAQRHTILSAVTIEGFRGLYPTVSTNIAHDGFLCDTGAGLLFSSSEATQQGVRLVGFSIRDSLNSGAPSDYRSWDPVPLIEAGRSFGWHVESIDVHGEDRRRYGMWVGVGNTIWGSSFLSSRFRYCQHGLVVGDQNDATHVAIIGCTIDHNKTCGLTLCNPHGGLVASNGIENNEGKTGTAILSGANGSTVPARAFIFMGNYCFNNGSGSTGVEVCNLIVGYDIPDSDYTTIGVDEFTSSSNAQQPVVEGNYLVSDHQQRAFKVRAFRGGRIVGNILLRRPESNWDGEVDGAPQITYVDDNFNQNTGQRDLVLDSSGNGYRKKVFALSTGEIPRGAADVIQFDDVGSISAGEISLGQDVIGWRTRASIKLERFEGTGGQWTTVIDVDGDLPASSQGFYELLLLLEQTNTAFKSIHKLYIWTDLFDGTPPNIAEPAGFLQDFSRPTAAVDGTQFRVNNGLFQIQRINNWQASGVLTALGAPFVD